MVSSRASKPQVNCNFLPIVMFLFDLIFQVTFQLTLLSASFPAFFHPVSRSRKKHLSLESEKGVTKIRVFCEFHGIKLNK